MGQPAKGVPWAKGPDGSGGPELAKSAGPIAIGSPWVSMGLHWVSRSWLHSPEVRWAMFPLIGAVACPVPSSGSYGVRSARGRSCQSVSHVPCQFHYGPSSQMGSVILSVESSQRKACKSEWDPRSYACPMPSMVASAPPEVHFPVNGMCDLAWQASLRLGYGLGVWWRTLQVLVVVLVGCFMLVLLSSAQFRVVQVGFAGWSCAGEFWIGLEGLSWVF